MLNIIASELFNNSFNKYQRIMTKSKDFNEDLKLNKTTFKDFYKEQFYKC